MIRSKLYFFLEGISQNWCCILIVFYQTTHNLICLIASNNLDPLIKILARSIIELLCDPLCNQKYFVGRCFEITKIFHSSSNFHPVVLAFFIFSGELITLMITKWWFSDSIIPSTFIRWHSIVRRSYLIYVCKYVCIVYVSIDSWILFLFNGL